MIVEGTQELVDNVRVERFAVDEYEELAETVRDALAQSETEEERLEAQFQLAYLEGDIAFLKNDNRSDAKGIGNVPRAFAKIRRRIPGRAN